MENIGNKQEKLKIQWVDIDDLKSSEYNPRKWTEKEINDLKESIKRFGIVDPLIVNSAENRKNIVIGGHFRLTILKELGYKKVPVVYVNIPDVRKEKELNLRLNRNLGEFDYELLAKFDEDLLRDVGFTEEELDEIFGMEIDDSFDVEKELEKTLEKKERRCKDGDLWQLGEHRLYIGDATKKESWEKLLGNEKIDMILTDPPYGLGGYAGRSGKFSPVIGDEGNVLRFYKAISIAKEMYIWGDWRFFTQIVNIFGMPRSIIVWKKPTFGMGRGYRRQYELLFYWGNYKGTKYGDVWEFEREKRYEHPTQKPVELCKRCIENSSPRGGIVVDCFGGSGSTLIACEIMKRRCRMIEIEPIYAEVILARWEKFTGKKAKKISEK
jgi:DNA modification methylase